MLKKAIQQKREIKFFFLFDFLFLWQMILIDAWVQFFEREVFIMSERGRLNETKSSVITISKTSIPIKVYKNRILN